MGKQQLCTARFGVHEAEGLAFLETDEVLFRGAFRVKIPRSAIRSVQAANGVLEIAWPKGTLALTLGPHADSWAKDLVHVKSRVEKLGVKEGSRVALASVSDAEIEHDLQRAGAVVLRGSASRLHLLLLGAGKKSDLSRIETARSRILPDGAIWVVYPKGIAAMREADVLAAGRAAGLKDVKVVRFSATHTALKFVVPLDKR